MPKLAKTAGLAFASMGGQVLNVLRKLRIDNSTPDPNTDMSAPDINANAYL